jgi:CHAT domain-containing protein/Tfp pilus assembly protein PilF
MSWAKFRWISMAPLGLGVLLLLATSSTSAQAPLAAPPAQLKEREKLAAQVDELRRAGKLDEALAAAERSLELERRAEGKDNSREAEALSRLAELHEFQGDWDRALARTKEALAVREQVDGKERWRTADARLAVAFAEKVAGMKALERAKVQAALRKEEESAPLIAQGKLEEWERVAMGTLETYRAVLGPESLEVARLWHQIGGSRLMRGDAVTSKEATERALAIRRKALPPGHPDIAHSLNNLGAVQTNLREYAAAKRSHEEALAIRRHALPPGHPDIAASLTNLGNAQVKSRDFAAAKRSYEEALAIFRQALPAGHPYIAKSLHNLESVQRELETPSTMDQAPGLSSPQQDKRLEERDRLSERVEELRRAGKLDEALAAAERAVELERRAGREKRSRDGNAFSRLAELHELRGDWDRALALRKEALTVCERLVGKDHWRTADARLSVAFAEKVAGLEAPDRARVQAALRIEEQSARLEAQNKFVESERAAMDALETYRALLGPEAAEVARAWHRVGLARDGRGDARGAKGANERALAIRRQVLPPGHPDIAHSLSNLGGVQDALGEYSAAKTNVEEALAIRRRGLPPGHPVIAQSLFHLGNVQYHLRDFAAAKMSIGEALAIYRKAFPDGNPDIASGLSNLGNVQLKLGEFAAAKRSQEEALAIFRKAFPAGHPAIAHSLSNLGAVQNQLRDFAAAKRSHEEALAIFRQALPAGHLEIAGSLNNLGNVQHHLREFAAAKRSHEEALAIRRHALPPGHSDIAQSLINLGRAQFELRDFAAAKTSFEEALAIRRQVRPPDHLGIANSLNNLGNVQHQLRDFAAAKRSHEEALAIRRHALPPGHPDIAASLTNLGIVQNQLRDFAAAKRSHEEALGILRNARPPGHPDIAASLTNLGNLSLASGIDGETAPPRLAEASDIYQAEQLRMAIAQAEPEQLATAVMARISLQLLIDATLTAGMPADTAYDRVVRTKGSVTAQQRWARQARDAADPGTKKLLDRLRDLSRDILGLSMPSRLGEKSNSDEDVSTLIRSLSDERGRLEQQLAERSGVYQAIQSRARIRGDDIRTVLPSETALIDLVEYQHVATQADGPREPMIEWRLVAFVSRPETKGVVAVPLGPSKDLADLIDRWRASYGTGKRPAVGTPDPGSELRKRLWQPLAKYLEGAKVILVSPDGPLNGLPWAALPGAKEGTFLVHEYAFAVVPTPQLLPEILRAKPRREGENPSLLLAGGIDFGEPKARAAGTPSGKLPPLPVFTPLPGAEREVNDLGTEFQGAFRDAPQPKVLSKDEATKLAVVAAAATHRFVHLATHGFFADEAEQSAEAVASRGVDLLRSGLHPQFEAAGQHPGLLSGVVFAGVNRSDRGPKETILTAFEASDLELGQVDLLVLSACDTGRGQVAGGEGVLGLQRAFQLAGARAVVASLWKVPDEETHLLMREFYGRIWSDKPLPRAEALRQAQLWMLEKGKGRGGKDRSGVELPERPQGPPLPYVWAAFVLSGDWR